MNSSNRNLSPTTASLSTYVRAGRPDDLPFLSELLVSSFYDKSGWTQWFYPVIKLGIAEDLRQRLTSPKVQYACLVAIRSRTVLTSSNDVDKTTEDIIIGTVEIAYRQIHFWRGKSQRYVYISNLAVCSDLRRQGIAFKLLKACESVAREWGYQDIFLHVMENNHKARRLYSKAGYILKETEETPLNWIGIASRRLLLQKSLP